MIELPMKACRPLVTMVLGTYNQEKFIDRAARSILNQTYENIEIIINNNGSTDNTKEVIDKYASLANVTIVNYENNNYLTKVENDAINLANGDFICFSAGDDYYLSNYVEEHIKAFDNLSKDYGVVYSPYFVENEQGKNRCIVRGFNSDGNVFDSLINSYFSSSYINAFTPMIRMLVAKDVRPDLSLFTEGESRFLRVASKYKFKYVDKAFYVMTEHAKNQGKNYKSNAKMFYNFSVKLIKTLPHKEDIINLTLARMFIRNAWISIRIMNDIKWARECANIATNYLERLENTRSIGVSFLIKNAFLKILLILGDGKILRFFNRCLNIVTGHGNVSIRKAEFIDYTDD